MRYIADSEGYVKEVSFGADITCAGQECTAYTGAVPSGYKTLEAWYVSEVEKLYRWQIIDGNLTLDSSALPPTDTDEEGNTSVYIGDEIAITVDGETIKHMESGVTTGTYGGLNASGQTYIPIFSIDTNGHVTTAGNYELPAYAQEGHNHDGTYLPLSGGTMTGPLVISGGDAVSGKGNIQLDSDGQITAKGTTATLFGKTSGSSNLLVGHSSHALLLRGSATRPTYNGGNLALYSDLSGYLTTSGTAAKATADGSGNNIVNTYATKTELAKKANDFTVELYNGNAGNPKPVKFATVNYSTCDSNNGVSAKISMVSGHGNGVSYVFLQDVIINVGSSGTVTVDNFKYFGAETPTYDSAVRQYGDVFYVIDTTNKIVDFYCLMGQYARVYQTPWKRLTYSSGGTLTQHTSCTVYSSGTKVWANNSEYALQSDLSSYLPLTGGDITNSLSIGNTLSVGSDFTVWPNGHCYVKQINIPLTSNSNTKVLALKIDDNDTLCVGTSSYPINIKGGEGSNVSVNGNLYIGEKFHVDATYGICVTKQLNIPLSTDSTKSPIALIRTGNNSLKIGDESYPTILYGSGARPTYNGAELALLSDVGTGGGSSVDLSGYAKLRTYNDFVHDSNEITMVPAGYSQGSLYFNYRTASGSQDGNINNYIFCNGQGGSAGVQLTAESFSGVAAKAIADGNGNTIINTYATKSQLSGYSPTSHTHSEYASASHTHDVIKFQDTRSANQTPLETPQGLSVHLKSNATDGVNDGGSFHPILTLRPWHDISGGPYGQITTTQNGNLYWRVSTAGNGSSWDGWQRAVKATELSSYSLTSHNHDSVYAKTATANTYNGEQKFQNSSYCPTVADTASGVGCAFKASRGMANEMLIDKLIMTASTGKIPFYKYTGTSDGSMTGLTEVASISSAGALTITGGGKISGRYAGGGDDEGLIIGRASNNYAGLCLGEPSGVRSVFYLMPDNSAVWRYNNGSSSYDIKHPGKAGTIALTSDIVAAAGGTTWTLLWTNSSVTSTFGPQTIGLNLSGYSAVIVEFALCPNDVSWYETEICFKGHTTTPSMVYYAAIHRRTVEVTDSGVTFTNCVRHTTYANSSDGTSNQNNRLVPYRIYGVTGVM